jgi:CBF1 interacting corepressor
MGKGFENYMSKKWFHPTNLDNQKRMHAAITKNNELLKRQNDLREQYEREQEDFSNKQLMGDEKARLGLSFIYNMPANTLKNNKDESDIQFKMKETKMNEEEVAAASAAAIKSSRDTSKIRCLKCKKLGHANTDKVCPMY